jgi:LacI family transcriptional regulator
MNNIRIRVALLIDKAGSYDRGLIRGIIRYARLSSDWDFFLEAPTFTAVGENLKRRLEKLKLWKPDCIIMNESFFSTDFTILDIPILVTPSKRLIPEVVNIVADDEKIGELGARYFIDKGYKNFAFYGTDQIFWSKIRKESFRNTVKALNLNFFQFESLLNDKWQSNVSMMTDWMMSLPKPIAIMACSDDFGIHIIEAANMVGIKVPEEVAILGVDNDEFICELYDPPMSSIDQEPENVGFKVAQFVKEIIKEGKKVDFKIIGTNFRIVTRRSSDIFAVEDDQLIKALTYIKANAAGKAISVEEVVSATTLSRRSLEIRFRKMLNRSVLQEIKQLRIETIVNKLTATNEPLSNIAYSLGFNSLASFSTYFKKEKKISPGEFRKQFRIK